MAEVQIATMRAQVALSLATDFENYSTFKPAPHHDKTLKAMLDQLNAWGSAMRTLRPAKGGHPCPPFDGCGTLRPSDTRACRVTAGDPALRLRE